MYSKFCPDVAAKMIKVDEIRILDKTTSSASELRRNDKNPKGCPGPIYK
jgi:hypothetical protein